MTLISIDTEASGPCPQLGDLISFGAVSCDDLSNTFFSGIIIPIFDEWNDSAYNSIGMTREQHETEYTNCYLWAFEEYLRLSSACPLLFVGFLVIPGA